MGLKKYNFYNRERLETVAVITKSQMYEEDKESMVRRFSLSL